MRIRTAAAVLLAATLWAAPSVAEASFNQQAASAQSVSTAMLHPPTNLTGSRQNCNLTLTWTPTVDARATGYQLLNGASLLQTITPKTVSTRTIALTKNANYSLTMRTVYLNWTSSATSAVTARC